MVSRTPLLFLDHASALGGAERSLLLLLARLDRQRWHPHLACPEGALADAAEALGLSVHPLPMGRLRRSFRAPATWLRTGWVLARLARDLRVSALVANTVRAALYGALAARLAGLPFLWYMRDFWLGEGKPRHLWLDKLGKRWLCAASARVIVNSHATASHLPCGAKVTVIHNGIEVERFVPMDGTAFRKRYGIPFAAPLVGTVGRLRPWKGQDRFLRLLARVRETRPEVWGVVVGGTPFGVEDDYPRRLRRLAERLGVAGQVVFTGQLADTRPALAAMDLFVHPGEPEPFGLVNIEAMAMARAVVAFAHGALPEIVADGETGLLVPAGDEVAMTEAVLRLLNDPQRLRVMGEAGRRRVVKSFHIERTVEAMEACLSSMASAHHYLRN